MIANCAFSALHQDTIGLLLKGIRAYEPVLSQNPEVTRLSDGRFGIVGRHLLRNVIDGLRCRRGIENDVDLAHLEAGELDLEIEVDQPLQLDRQHLLVPPGLLGEAVVGQGVGTDFCGAQVLDAENGNRGQPELLCGFDTAVAGNDLPVGVRQDRVHKPKPLDRAGDLLDLPRRMGARVIGVGLELVQRRLLHPFAGYKVFSARFHP